MQTLLVGLSEESRQTELDVATQAPEMVRVPLEELVLQILLLGLGPAGQFLDKVLEPPPKASVEGALARLQALGALTAEQQLTPLGDPNPPDPSPPLLSLLNFCLTRFRHQPDRFRYKYAVQQA